MVNIVSPPTVPARYDTLTSPRGASCWTWAVSPAARSQPGVKIWALSAGSRTAMGSARLEKLWEKQCRHRPYQAHENRRSPKLRPSPLRRIAGRRHWRNLVRDEEAVGSNPATPTLFRP